MILMSVLVSGVSLLVGVLMGIAVGRNQEKSRWESRIGQSVMDSRCLLSEASSPYSIGRLNPSSRSHRTDRLTQGVRSQSIANSLDGNSWISRPVSRMI